MCGCLLRTFFFFLRPSGLKARFRAFRVEAVLKVGIHNLLIQGHFSQRIDTVTGRPVASQLALDTAVTQNQNKLVTFNTMISSLQSNLDQQDRLAVAQGDVANNLVQVYRTLGGAGRFATTAIPSTSCRPA